MSIFAANMLSESEDYGFSCLRCKAITRSAPKITFPGDDSPTYLSLGQREEVYCPICREMRTGEFVLLTNMNANRVVDAGGNQVYPQGLPSKNAYGGGGAYAQQQQQLPASTSTAPPPQGAYLQGTILPANTMPTPLSNNSSHQSLMMAGSPPPTPANSNNGTVVFSLPSNQSLEKHLMHVSDDEVRNIKKDLQSKLQVVETALMERRKCVICCERDKCVVLLPCKHMSLCKECSEKVNECPVCKVAVADRIVPYSS